MRDKQIDVRRLFVNENGFQTVVCAPQWGVPERYKGTELGIPQVLKEDDIPDGFIIIPPEVVNNNKVIVSKAGLGRGKTHTAQEYMQAPPFPKSVFITPRIILTNNFVHRFNRVVDERKEKTPDLLECKETGRNLEYIKNYRGDEDTKKSLSIDEINSGSIVICILSLMKIRLQDFSNSVVVIDEIESVLSMLGSNLLKAAEAQEIYNHLINLLVMAKKVFILDANVGPSTYYLLEKAGLKEETVVLQCDNKPRPWGHFENKKQHRAFIVDQLKDHTKDGDADEGKRLLIGFMSKVDAEAFGRFLRTGMEKGWFPRMNLMVVTSDSFEEKKLIREDSSILKEQTCVIFTQSIDSGVDISSRDWYYCTHIFLSNSSDGRTADQMSGRLRYPIVRSLNDSAGFKTVSDKEPEIYTSGPEARDTWDGQLAQDLSNQREVQKQAIDQLLHKYRINIEELEYLSSKERQELFQLCHEAKLPFNHLSDSDRKGLSKEFVRFLDIQIVDSLNHGLKDVTRWVLENRVNQHMDGQENQEYENLFREAKELYMFERVMNVLHAEISDEVLDKVASNEPLSDLEEQYQYEKHYIFSVLGESALDHFSEEEQQEIVSEFLFGDLSRRVHDFATLVAFQKQNFQGVMLLDHVQQYNLRPEEYNYYGFKGAILYDLLSHVKYDMSEPDFGFSEYTVASLYDRAKELLSHKAIPKQIKKMFPPLSDETTKLRWFMEMMNGLGIEFLDRERKTYGGETISLYSFEPKSIEKLLLLSKNLVDIWMRTDDVAQLIKSKNESRAEKANEYVGGKNRPDAYEQLKMFVQK